MEDDVGDVCFLGGVEWLVSGCFKFTMESRKVLLVWGVGVLQRQFFPHRMTKSERKERKNEGEGSKHYITPRFNFFLPIFSLCDYSIIIIIIIPSLSFSASFLLFNRSTIFMGRVGKRRAREGFTDPEQHQCKSVEP